MTSMKLEKQKLDKYGWRLILREYLSRVLILLFLLVALGRLDWPQAWTLFWLLVALNILFHLVVVIPAPDLYNERGRILPNTEPWDRRLLAVYALSGYLALAVAGLDKRFGWTFINASWLVPGAILVTLSFALSAWSMRVNRFFSSVVRIQDDRGQIVCDQGPYRLIRHPGYLCGLIFYIGLPLMLGVAAGFIFVPVITGLFVYRIIREEQTLTENLAGYKEYRERVRYRLLPGIW